jgi:TolA-binding protein
MSLIKLLSLTLLMALLSGCQVADEVYSRVKIMNHYERVSLRLAKENRLLGDEINRLQYKIQTLEARNNFLKIKLDKKLKKSRGRQIASVKAKTVTPKHDLVNYDIYKWGPNQLVSIAETEFNSKNFEKSAQYFRTFISRFAPTAMQKDPNFDDILFQAGLASYESGKHYDWAVEHLNDLIKKYPTSKHYRGAKLWLALAELKRGNKKKFYNTVEEFRLKYRNTPEWKILSGYYEEFTSRYKGK